MTSTLPSTESSGADNARAKLGTILAIYELQRFANLWDDDKKLFPLSADAVEICEDAGFNFDTDDLTADHIRDASWDACRSVCLGVDYSATWSAGCEFDGQPDRFKVWLTVGGPSCYITGDFGLRGAVDPDSLRVWFSWAGPSDFLRVEHDSIEAEALAWFVDQVSV